MTGLGISETDNNCWCPGSETGARWIFPERPDGAVNQFVDFLHVFECSEAVDKCGLKISADTDFSVWLNGHLLGSGQFSNYPDRKTYELFSANGIIRKGRNTLAVTVFYNGSDSSVYRRGQPGLVFELAGDDFAVISGCETLCRMNPCYHSGPIAKVSGQLFYTFGYDARGDDGFNSDGYVPDDQWAALEEDEATIPAERSRIYPRPVARLSEGQGVKSVIKAAGRFLRDKDRAGEQNDGLPVEDTSAGLLLSNGTVVSAAWLMQNDFLASASTFDLFKVKLGTALDAEGGGLSPAVGNTVEGGGIYLVVDLGREEAGHVELEVEASAGVFIDIGYGEHLDDLRVRTFVGGRNFAARYICRQGRQVFVHRFQRWSGRYLQMHIHTAAFRLYRLTLNSSEYPVENRGIISLGGSQLHSQIEKVARRTLCLCMHEHYEDTPWREQALYANDARIQALCGYYAFGESRFPASSFDLLGRGLRPDGFLELTAPARPRVTIPSFTLAWMLAVRDHFLYSGDDSLARDFLPQILSMLDAFIAECKDGLLPLRRERGVWHFYDWSGGMSGYSDELFATGLQTDAPLNCFLILAVEAAMDIIRWTGGEAPDGLDQFIQENRRVLAESFWDSGEGAFRTHNNTDVFTELTQALCVLAGVGSDAQREAVMRRLGSKDSKLLEAGLSQSFYTFQACMKYKDICGQRVLDDIEEKWGMMIKAGATSFWETTNGASDFHNAGSLCHGWSAVPLYIYYHNILGVQPLEPGFRSFTVDPCTGGFGACAGTVSVPGGEIRLKWQKRAGQVEVRYEAPDNCRISSGGACLTRDEVILINENSL